MMFTPDPALLFSLAAASLGLIVGSFANVVIYRLPLELSIAFPASRCPQCEAAIRPWQNIPILSWLWLGGRCASCGAPISSRYPLVEAIHGLGFAAVIVTFGLTPFTPFVLLFFFGLVVLAFIDWDHQILPDWITLPLTALGLVASLTPGALITWKEAALAAVLGYLAFFLVAEGYSRLRGIEGLGMGDWKLAAMIGAFLGVRHLMLVVFLGSVSGLVYGLIQAQRQRRALAEVNASKPGLGLQAPLPADDAPSDRDPPASEPSAAEPETKSLPPLGLFRLPFGTFLAAAAILVLFLGDRILIWYSGLFRF